MCRQHCSPTLVIMLGLLAASLVGLQSARAAQTSPIRFEEIRVAGRSMLPSPDRATLLRSEGPEEHVSFEVVVDRSIRDGQAYLEVRKDGTEGEPFYTGRVDFSSRRFDLDHRFTSVGNYVVTARVAGQAGSDTIRLSIEAEPDVGAPSLKSLLNESIGGVSYRPEQVDGIFHLIDREFTAVVKTHRPGRKIALIDVATGNVIGEQDGTAIETVWVRANADRLLPGRRTVFAVDTWSGERSSEEIQVDVPEVDALERSLISGLATARFAPMRPLNALATPINFHGWFQMQVLEATPVSLLIYRDEGGTFRRDRESERKAITRSNPTSGNSRVVTVNLQDLPAGEHVRMFVQSQAEGSPRRISPRPLRFQVAQTSPQNSALPIRLDSVRPIAPDSGQRLPASDAEDGIETYLTNARRLELTFSAPDHEASQLVLLPKVDPAMEAREAISNAQALASLPEGAVIADRKAGGSWSAEIAPSDGEHNYRAVLYSGGRAEAVSKPSRIVINRNSPTLSTIGPADFGVVPGVSTLVLTIEGNPLVGVSEVPAAQFRLYAATGRDTFEQLPLLPIAIESINRGTTQEIRLSFDPMRITQNRYRLEIVSDPKGIQDPIVPEPRRIQDQFGNTLIDGEGGPGDLIRRELGVTGVSGMIPERGGMTRPTIVRILRPGEVDEQANSRGGAIKNGLLEAISARSRPPMPTASWVFDRPARFSLTQFGPSGKDFEEEGAVIYEGMELVVAADGRYQVRFMISTPAMPMTLRLVLFVQERGKPHPMQVTLPPIVLPPHRNARGDYEAATWYVMHEGTLPMLAWGFGQIEWAMTRRDGVARLGSYPTRPGSPAFYFGDAPGLARGSGF